MPSSPRPGPPQDVYASLLFSSSRGYPLWVPEPSNELLAHRREGLRIGDVGVVLADGGFEVLFNICLPPDHHFHRRHGVPEGFGRINEEKLDFRTVPNAENPGCIISTSSVARTTVSGVDQAGVDPLRATDNLNYEFKMSSGEGALLILPQGAESFDLRNEDVFLQEAKEHGAQWYRFARERLRRIISDDSLYLITGFHKTRSWSVAAYQNLSCTDFPARFKTREIKGGNISAAYAWDASPSLEWRAGPAEAYGLSNQAVFIRGLKIALQPCLFGMMQWINVEADAPSTRSNPPKASGPVPGQFSLTGILGMGKLWGNSTSERGTHDRERANTTSTSQLSRVFHPSDVINQHLLSQNSGANISVTSDSHWIALLDKGLLKFEDLMQQDRLLTAVSTHYRVVSHGGCVYLQSKSDSTSDGYQGDRELPKNDTSQDMVKGDLEATIGTHLGQTEISGCSASPCSSRTDPRRIYAPTHAHSPSVQNTIPASKTPLLPNALPQMESSAVLHNGMQSDLECRNIIFFGEAGTGKSSIINLLLDSGTTAEVSNNAEPCTRVGTCYKCQLDGTRYNLWDTRGLGEASWIRRIFGRDSESTTELKRFLRERFHNGEIDLLVYCVRASRATKASQKYYNTFCTETRRLVAPVVVVATESEKFSNMEDWWRNSVSQFQKLKMEFDGHACITALPEDPRADESRERLLQLIAKDFDWKPQGRGKFFGSPALRPVTPEVPKKVGRSFSNFDLRKTALLNRTARSNPAPAKDDFKDAVPSPSITSAPTPDHQAPPSPTLPTVEINGRRVSVSHPSLLSGEEMDSAKCFPLESYTPPESFSETPPPGTQVVRSRPSQCKCTAAPSICPSSSSDSKSSTPITESPSSTVSSMFPRSKSSSRTSVSLNLEQEDLQSLDEANDGLKPEQNSPHASAATEERKTFLRQPSRRRTGLSISRSSSYDYH